METSLMIASAGKWFQILTTLDANDHWAVQVLWSATPMWHLMSIFKVLNKQIFLSICLWNGEYLI